VAARFQGGGHACAAGLSVKAPPADFEAQLLAAMAERLAKPPAPAA
jgi:phosphoesterase RecJ-like protein